jgi:serine protease AprX
MSFPISLAAWRWGRITWTVLLATATLTAALASPAAASVSPDLAKLADEAPTQRVEVIVRGANVPQSDVLRKLELIDAVVFETTAREAVKLGEDGAAVSLNAPVVKTGTPDPAALLTSFNQSIRAERAWASGWTGKGIGVAVIDTGIRGDLPDFRASETDHTSRVVASAVVNPAADDANDTFGHGTHIAGLIAGNGTNRDAGDPLKGRYAGVAPDAHLIAIKADDGHGAATVADVIDGLQFAVDFRRDYNIRVVNLSLRSTSSESYKTDPLAAAAEQAVFAGLVVVAAAGNDGQQTGAVDYAPANDPFVLTVGGVDDKGTKDIADDQLAPWSSRGRTQDGLNKPDVVAPGSRLVSTLSPGSDYASLCPQCVTSDGYFRVGGTSMAAAVVSGEVAQLLQAFPAMTPALVKATITKRTRAVEESASATSDLVDGSGQPVPTTVTVTTTITGAEAATDKAILNPTTVPTTAPAISTLLDPLTKEIDWARASWTRASWTTAVDGMRASWTRASWTRASWTRASWTATRQSCTDFERASWTRASWTDAEIAWAKDQCVLMDPTRASWTRASWTRASWTSSFEK